MTVCIVPNKQIHVVLKLDSTVWHLLNDYVCLYIDVLVNCHAENDIDRSWQPGGVMKGEEDIMGAYKSFEAVWSKKKQKKKQQLWNMHHVVTSKILTLQ